MQVASLVTLLLQRTRGLSICQSNVDIIREFIILHSCHLYSTTMNYIFGQSQKKHQTHHDLLNMCLANLWHKSFTPECFFWAILGSPDTPQGNLQITTFWDVTNLLVLPKKPIMEKPIAQATAIFLNSFASGLVHRWIKRRESIPNSMAPCTQ